MIPVQNIVDRMASRIDAENSQRYLFEQDYMPAINAAQEWVVTVLSKYLGGNKFSAEGLRELSFTRIWQTNAYSRISFDPIDMNGELWSIIGVYPKVKANQATGAATQTDKSKSLLRKDLSFISSEESATRLTAEEWNINSKNVFEPGNNILKNELGYFGYRDFSNYTSTSYSGATGIREIGIRPDVPNELVGVEYLKFPTLITAITDNLEFPFSMTNFLTDKSLSYLAWKQGDSTTLFSVSESEEKQLLSILAA